MNEKKKHKVMIGIEVVLLCMIIATLRTNAASSNPPSNGVSYNKNNQVTVQNALDDLYNKANYGNAAASQILKGRTALVKGKQVTGTYEAPTCPTLASQTPGDATEYDIAKGKIAWVNGEKVVGQKNSTIITNFVSVGDYIQYVPSKASYVVASSDTGYDMAQNIIPKEAELWRIIKKNADGTIEIVSATAVSSGIYFKGETGYKNYVGTLNKIAAAYETEGITVGSRHMGYNGTVAEHLESVGENGNEDYGHRADVDLVEEAIGGIDGGGTYYLASRNSFDVYDDASYSKHLKGGSFSVRVVGRRPSYTYYSCIYACMPKEDCCGYTTIRSFVDVFATYGGEPKDGYVNVFPSSGKYKVRPIVILKSDIALIGGNGTSGNPWIVGI